ncbi:MAG: hypothetical protein EXQ58_07260 [Acidobacteria bacterium]|nr:hypothetical protein [Acidobacteriota bacterium]
MEKQYGWHAGLLLDEVLDDCSLAKLHSDQPFAHVVGCDVTDLGLNLKSSLIPREFDVFVLAVEPEGLASALEVLVPSPKYLQL